MNCQNCGAEMEIEEDYDHSGKIGRAGKLLSAKICKCNECGREERRVSGRSPVILCKGAQDISKQQKCF